MKEAVTRFKQLNARLPQLGTRVCFSAIPCRYRCGRNEVWVCFSRGFSPFPLPQISFHHFSRLNSSFSFHFISSCDAATGVVGRHPCYSLTFSIGASTHLIPRPEPVSDTSWGCFFLYWGQRSNRTSLWERNFNNCLGLLIIESFLI